MAVTRTVHTHEVLICYNNKIDKFLMSSGYQDGVKDVDPQVTVAEIVRIFFAN